MLVALQMHQDVNISFRHGIKVPMILFAVCATSVLKGMAVLIPNGDAAGQDDLNGALLRVVRMSGGRCTLNHRRKCRHC